MRFPSALHYLGECGDLLDVELHLALEPLGQVGADDTEAVDDECRAERELRELLAHAQRGEPLGVAADENEAVEIAAVRLEEHGLEALDRPLLLEPRVVAEDLVEEVSTASVSRPRTTSPQPTKRPASAIPHLLLEADASSIPSPTRLPLSNVCSPRYNGAPMSQTEALVVHGAREHNLKNVTVRIPRDALVCITGLSGSGKSSLAFDTIYAEGQRRYVESLSAYARQFLQMMEKPDVDSIDGLSPAISIDQKTTSRNPRSTVGTVTEIYDYLRLLYARIGRPHCPVCGRPIAGQSLDQIVEQVLRLDEGTKFTVNAPVVRDRKGEYKDVLEELRRDGFTRVKVDGEQRLLEEDIVLDKKFKHTIEVVVDRLVMKADLRQRLTQSIETATSLAEGLVVIDVVDGDELTFSENLACPDHGVSLAELEPRVFSFNSPHGACPRCTGLGAQLEIDPDLLVPDASLSIEEGALVPWTVGSQSFYDSVIEAIAERYEIPLDVPWRELTTEQQDKFLHGTGGERIFVTYRNRMGRKRQYTMAFEGLLNEPPATLPGDRLLAARDRIEEYMSFRPCPECNGARLKPEVLAVTIGDRSIHGFTQMSVTTALRFVDELELTKTEELIGRRILKEVRERLMFLENVGVGYLQLDRAAKTLSGGEAQRLRLATQIGSQLVGVLYILDEPSIGLHQRDNGRLIATLERLRDVGNTVLVVEHDEQMMRSADWVVDLGPGRRRARGRGGRGRRRGHDRGDAGLGHRPVPER